MAAFDEIFGAPPGSYPFHANAELAASRRCARWMVRAGLSASIAAQHYEVPDLMHW